MQRAENVADGWQVDPLVAVQAEQVLPGAFHMLSIDNEIAWCNSQHGQNSEEEIAVEQEPGLPLEQLLVELKFVPADRWQVFVVDHVVAASEVDVIELVDPDYDDECDEIHWVDRFVAIFHEKGWDEESKRDKMHTHAENVVEGALLARQPGFLLLLRDHRINNDTEGDEERVLREKQDDEKTTNVPARELVDC